MKIVFTGGGTGGHFYPLIAVAQELNELVKEKRLVGVKLYYFSDAPYNSQLLYENNIEFVAIPAGKLRRYFSLKNLTATVVTGWGIIIALIKLYLIFPDAIFSKGAYASFPSLWAARLLGIPVIIHESDAHPGRVSLWSGKFARRVAVSYPEAATYFPPARTAVTGNPIRRELRQPITLGAREFLKLEPNLPTIFITGGSLGAQAINDVVLDILPELVKKFQIIHQVGDRNFDDVKKRSALKLENSPERGRYQVHGTLNTSAMQMIAGVADLVISRAGSIIFEIAIWGTPSIIIPIPEEISHDQRHNAFNYARSGGAIVIEQINLTPSVLLGEINRLLSNPQTLATMKAGAKSFSRPEAAHLIAYELLNLALEHEQ